MVTGGFGYIKEQWYYVPPPLPRTPIEVAADSINSVGVRVLQQYFDSGNVAFSPTGLTYVMIALYEGSAGRGNRQIEAALNLPREREATKIGFRDLHRRLRVSVERYKYCINFR